MLFITGSVNRRRIQTSKRTSGFTDEDFDLLVRLIDHFGKLIATPHVLSQVSDLTNLKADELRRGRRFLSVLVQRLADAALATVCSRGVLVLTADLDLHIALSRSGADSLNFNHLRPFSWTRR